MVVSTVKKSLLVTVAVATSQALANDIDQSTPFYYSTSGCNSTSGFDLDASGHVNRTLESGRTYLLHIPDEYDGSFSHPLVISFHGAGGTSAKQEKLSQFSEPGLTIAGLPIIAAYPQGAPNTTANQSASWASAPYANTTVDDVQFVKDIIADVSSNYCLNPTRYYAAGKSNGGGFTNLLACLPDTTSIFAAFAPVSPALYPGSLAFEGCNPSRPVPLITSHGIEDQTIPYYGRVDSDSGEYGVGRSTINVTDWRLQWAIRNGCPVKDGQVQVGDVMEEKYPDTTEYFWQCEAEIKAFTGSKLGHSWPTTEALDGSGAPNNTASYNLTTQEMVQFFSANTLPLWAMGS